MLQVQYAGGLSGGGKGGRERMDVWGDGGEGE